MPASMMTACVASSPNVTGNRMLMPDSGPIPGNTPTSVPTRQPKKAYQRLAGCNATENPCSRLSRVLSTRSVLESHLSGRQLRLLHPDEHSVGERHHGDAVDDRAQRVAPLDDQQQGEHHQHHRQEEAEPRVERDRRRRDGEHHQGMPALRPVEPRERLALIRAKEQGGAEDDHERGDELGQETGARHGELPGRQVAAEREHKQADRDEGGARHVVGPDDHASHDGPKPAYPCTRPIRLTAASMRLASASQNLAKSGPSRYSSSWPRLVIAVLNGSLKAAFLSDSRR